MKPNNLFLIPCTENSFYRAWMEFLTPYHKLTSREKDVAAVAEQIEFHTRRADLTDQRKESIHAVRRQV